MIYNIRRTLVISISIIIIIQSIGFCQEMNIPRMRTYDFRESFVEVYESGETDSVGFDAMEALGKNYEGEPIEIIGNIEWHRPYCIKAESEEKIIPDLTFGDFYIPANCIVFYFEWLTLNFHEDYIPYVGPELEEYGLEKSVSDYFPLSLPGEFIIIPDNDTLKGYAEVVVRGIVDINWKRGLRTKHGPMESISLKECRIIEIWHPAEE